MNLRIIPILRNTRSTLARLAIALACVALLAACETGVDTSGGPWVVASFYPLAEAAVVVGHGRAAVTDLTPAGVEPHDLELSTDEVDDLLDADLVLYLGGGFQPAVEDVAADRDPATTVDVLAALQPELPAADDAASGPDPHIWLDPVLMARMVEEVTDGLVRVDPRSRSRYERNARGYVRQLTELDRDFRRGLADCERDLVVTSHEAFGYLTARYELRQVGITGVSPDAEPDPARIAELADLVRTEGVTTIFTEELQPADAAETLARETGAEVAVLDPLEALSEEKGDAGADYVTVMQENLAALREGLGCS